MNILITRPLSSALSLKEKITVQFNHKINAVIFSVIEVIETQFEILSQINLSEMDMMIFISPAAVEHSVRYISNISNHIRLFSIGKDTAEKIDILGLGKAIYPIEKFNSEGLLDLKELKEIKNKNIIIFKGKGGNTLLTEMLRMRGANVREAVVYERRLPKPDTLPDLNQIDLIICTSSESMKNLIILLGEAVKSKRLLVSSEKLQKLAETLGFKPPALLAENAGDEALIAALTRL